MSANDLMMNLSVEIAAAVVAARGRVERTSDDFRQEWESALRHAANELARYLDGHGYPDLVESNLIGMFQALAPELPKRS